MSLDYKILGQELVSYTTVEETIDTTSYYVSYEEGIGPRFVAIAGNFFDPSSAYSSDGVNWSQSTLPLPSYEIIYGNNNFLVVSSTQAAYSEDGITWTLSSLPFNSGGYANQAAYGNGVFVAVGGGTSAVYSTDGLSWSSTTIPNPNNHVYQALTYGNGKFVAVLKNKAAYSTDGVSWTETNMPSFQDNWRHLVYGAGSTSPKFLTVSADTNIYATSNDGITWSQSTSPINSLTEAAFGDGKYILIGSNGSSQYEIAFSTDGNNWTKYSLPYSVGGISYGNGKFVGINNATFPGTATYSADGINWNSSSFPTSNWWSRTEYGQVSQLIETLNIIGGQGTTQTEEFLPVTIYTVPAGKQTTVTSVYVANQNNTETTYDFAVVPSGEELSLKHHLRWDMPIAANDFEAINTKITMSAGDKLVIFPSTVDTVSVTAFGVEK